VATGLGASCGRYVTLLFNTPCVSRFQVIVATGASCCRYQLSNVSQATTTAFEGLTAAQRCIAFAASCSYFAFTIVLDTFTPLLPTPLRAE
jgi:hypothetical protein